MMPPAKAVVRAIQYAKHKQSRPTLTPEVPDNES
jgi:hypothetical protein